MATNLLALTGDGLATLWIELAFVTCFSLGFLLLRSGHRKFGSAKSKQECSCIAQKPFYEFKEKSRKLIEDEAAAERWPNVLEAWRKEKDHALTPKDLLKPVARAFLETKPDDLAKEIASHLKNHLHPEDRKVWTLEFVSLPVLDLLARAGKTSLMEEFWELLPHDRGYKYSARLYDVLLGGFANAGQLGKVQYYEAMMRRERIRLSARGFSLVIKGFLKNGFVKEVLEKLLEMKKQSYEVPSFAVAQFFRVASEAGRMEEFFDAAVQNSLEISIEAYMVLLDGASRTGNLLVFLKKVEKSVRSAYTEIPVAVAEVFIKVYLTRCQEKAIEIFRQNQSGWSETFIVRLLGRCAEQKHLTFTEEIMIHYKKSNVMTLAIYSALMKVYAYSGLYERACDLYEDIQKDGIAPDSMMYGCLMKFAMECGRTSLLNDLAAKVSQLDIQHYMTMIRSAGSDQDVNRAFAIFEELKKSPTIAVDIVAYNCLLDVCCRAGDMKMAKQLTKEMQQMGMVDSITFNTLIKGLLDAGDVRGAKMIQKEMREAGVPANDVSYNCLINAAVKAGNLKEAWDLVHEMEAGGIAPDRYTVSTMMKTLRKATPPGHVQKCFDLLGRSGVALCQDEILLNIVLETSARHKDFKRIEWTVDLFEKSNMRPSTPTYGSLIKAYGMLKCPEKCWAAWKQMTEMRGLKPTHIVIGCMLDALVCNGLIDDAERIFEEHAHPPNMILYSILFKGAMALWRQMRTQGLKMNTVGYNSVIDSQARHGNLEELSEILAAMDEEAVEPDSVTHSIIVKAYCVRGDLHKAMQAIQNIQASKVEHDAVVYNTCFDACYKHGKLHFIEKLLKDMIDHNIAPTNFTLGILVKACGRFKQLDKAFKMVEELPKIGKFTPNGQVWISLVLSCITNERPRKALEVFHEMQSLGHEAFQVLVSGLVKNGYLRAAVEMVDEVLGLRPPKKKHSKVSSESECMEALFAAISRRNLRRELGLPLLERLRAAQLPVSSRILTCTFESPPDAKVC